MRGRGAGNYDELYAKNREVRDNATKLTGGNLKSKYSFKDDYTYEKLIQESYIKITRLGEGNVYTCEGLRRRTEAIDKVTFVCCEFKKKNQSPEGAELSTNVGSPIKGSSTVSVADILEVVNDDFSDVLSEDALKKIGATRAKSTLSDSVRYSFADEDRRLIFYTTKGSMKKVGNVNGNSIAENAKGPGQNTHL